jgi:hypothetical protein
MAISAAVVLAGALMAAVCLPMGFVSSAGLSRGWGLLVSAITVTLAVASLIELARMLREVEKGRVFAITTMRRFRRFSTLFLMCALANVSLPPLIQIALLIASRGRGEVAVMISDSALLALVAGALMFFIARMFDEAARLDDDSRSIV